MGILSSQINYPNCTQNIVVAVADTATVFGVPIVLNVLANDYDPDDGEIDPLSLALHRDSISQGPYHGKLSFNNNGTLTYTPELEYNGLDSFVYRVCDDFSPTACDTAIVRLTLWYNAPIIARTDHEIIYIGQTALIGILDNDTDPEGKIDLTSIDLLDDPKNGNAIINPDGTITYRPLTGFTGTDSLLYTVCDLGTPRTCDTAWVYIHVKQNETIVANRDDIETFAGSPVTFDPIINDFDPEGEIDTTSLQILTIANPKHGTATVTNGMITYIPDQGFAGLDLFVYRLCDAGSPVTCDTAMVYVNVVDNNLGIVANPDLAYAIDWEPVTVKILSNDFDPDTISSIDPSTVILTSQPLNGTVLLNPDGSLTYTPNPGFLGNDTLIYQVCDNAPIVACDTALVVLISSSVLPPVAANDTLNLMHGAPFSFDIIGNDYDPAGRLDSTSLTIVNPPANGELAFDISTGVYTYQPDQCNFSLDSFTYHVSNTSGLTSNIAVVYLNTSINPKLDLDGDSILDLDEDLANTGNLCDTDTDKDGTPDFLDPDDDDDFIPTIEERGDLDDNGVPDYLENWNSKAVDDNILTGVDIPVWIPVMNNDSLTMLSTTLHPTENPKHGYIVVNQANGGFNYYPEFDYMGNDSFRYVVCDHYDICDTALVTIAVEDILVAPELFTPNDDGNNDRYVISGIENYPKNLFLVYNRWGNKVYEKENYANEWDGTSNANMRLGNQVLPVGVYYYILRYSDRREKQGGLYLER